MTANTACPGSTDTKLLDEITEFTEDAGRVLESLASAAAMKRLGQLHEVASAVAFFAGEDAGFIKGQTLSASGGLTLA